MSFPILSRNNKDIDRLSTHSTTNSIIIYPEGTRFNPAKREEAISLANRTDIPISKYSLVPKSKGTFSLLKNESFLSITYSFIVYYDKYGSLIENFGNMQFPQKVYVHNKTYKRCELPIELEKFKLSLQKEFTSLDRIVKEKKAYYHKIVCIPKLDVMFLTYLCCMYPFIIFAIFCNI